METNRYLGNIVDNRVPADYIIRKEPEPLLNQGFAYHAYCTDGQPCYYAEATIEELIARLKRGYAVKTITVEGVSND